MARWTGPVERLIATRGGAWFMTHVAMRIDRVLMPLTRGRVRVSMVIPSGLLICRGAKSGAERRIPLTYVPLEGDRIGLIASNGGGPSHPAWYHNLRAYPEVRFAARGREIVYRARLVEGEEREQLWKRANAVYMGYDTYQGRTSREIGLFVLDPV
jgi:F420H(2)-dependent quinone reductase